MEGLMWLIAEYAATTLFTLKPATATASGGKTLLVPTPFAVKMALLDVACRLEGQAAAGHIWEAWLAELRVALRPARTAVVNNTFIKILKPRRNPAQPGTQHAGFFQQTITYREYAQLVGPFGIALEVDSENMAAALARWLLNINYLGKRGSFVQLQEVPYLADTLPEYFIAVGGELSQSILIDALLTQLDDVGEGMSFDHANIYSGKRIQLGKQRILHHVALPYRLVSSSRGYSHYQLDGTIE
jgi:hypothetical protein